MSLVVNMQQRRTLAAGRQNQEFNQTVAPEKELTVAKKLSADVKRSIQEVLHHRKNTTGRGRQIVSAELQKKQEAENSPPVGVKSPISGNRLLGGSAKKKCEVGHISAVAPVIGNNKLSISEIRKRHLDPEDGRAPLSALREEPENDWTDRTPVKTSPKEGTFVYTKRQKTKGITTPTTPPLRSSSLRRREAREASPPSPPLLASSRSSPDWRIMTTTTTSSSELPADMDTSQPVDIDTLQPVNRQLRSPTVMEDDSDPYGFNAVRGDLEESNALVLWSEPETPVHDVDNQSFSILAQSPRKSHGLVNLGNTCYMNVIIQCLYNLRSFVTGMERLFGPLVKQNEDLETLFSSDVEGVHAALLKVFRDLKRAERYDTVNPTVLKDAFVKQQSSFWGCIQQDAHEFFCSLIDQVQEEVSSELKKQYSIEAERPKLETVCPTTQNFSCLVRNNLTCAGCGNVSSVEETYRDFCLALPEDERIDESQKCSLESLLNLYFQETTMSRKCEKCGAEDTKAQAQILKLPHVLVLQLKRLHMDRDVPCTKVSAPVKFTSRLDIGPWCAKDKQKFWSPTLNDVVSSASNDSVASSCTTTLSEGSLDWGSFTSSEWSLDCEPELVSQELHITTPKPSASSVNVSTGYILHGVVNHLGFTASAGHFLTDVLDPEADTWLRCDDSLVSNVLEDSVFANEREAYMFFYVHDPAVHIKEKLD